MAHQPPKESKKKRKDGDPPRPPIVSIGNALFTQKGFTPVQAFLTTLAEQYGAGVRPVDFASDAALDQINASNVSGLKEAWSHVASRSVRGLQKVVKQG